MQKHYEFKPQSFLLNVKGHSARIGFFCEHDIAVYFDMTRQELLRLQADIAVALKEAPTDRF